MRERIVDGGRVRGTRISGLGGRREGMAALGVKWGQAK